MPIAPFHSDNGAQPVVPPPAFPRDPEPTRLDALDEIGAQVQFVTCAPKRKGDEPGVYAVLPSGETMAWALVPVDEEAGSYADGWRPVPQTPCAESATAISARAAQAIARAIATRSGATVVDRDSAGFSAEQFEREFNKPFAVAPQGDLPMPPMPPTFEDIARDFDLDSAELDPEDARRTVSAAWRSTVTDDPRLQPDLADPMTAYDVLADVQAAMGVDPDILTELREIAQALDALLDRVGHTAAEREVAALEARLNSVLREAGLTPSTVAASTLTAAANTRIATAEGRSANPTARRRNALSTRVNLLLSLAVAARLRAHSVARATLVAAAERAEHAEARA